MSEVSDVKGVGSGDGGVESSSKDVGSSEQVAVMTTKMVAPALRVEELRDDDGHSSTGTYSVSEEEGAHSHGETGLSDNEKNSLSKSPQGEFQPPDDELRDRIIGQVEFYFSDANILKDAFLLKHVRRNKQGYVSLKLITSFKKVKSITKDYRVVAYSLRQSTQLEVNEEGTKVRRTDPLPDYDETTPSRTVVAVNLQQETPTIESVAELFKLCGEIALIRILRPGKGVPQDVKKHINKHPEIGTTLCAVVEFEDHGSAKKACELLTDKDDWRKGMRVVLLAAKKNKDKEKSKKKDEAERGDKTDDAKSGDDRMTDGKDSDGEKNDKRRRKRGGKTQKRKNSRVDELINTESPNYSSDSGGEALETTPPRNRSASAGQIGENLNVKGRQQRNSLSPKPDHNRLSPSNTPRTSPASSPRSSPRGSPNTGRRKLPGRSPLATELSPGNSPRPSPGGSPECRRRSMNLEDKGDGTGSSPSSPWVQRRLKAQQASQPSSSPGASPRLGRRLPDGTYEKNSSPRMLHEERIIRQPKGPDGTRGFAAGVGRGKPRSETM